MRIKAEIHEALKPVVIVGLPGPQTLENRVARLEEFQSDMLACYRIRLSGCATLERRCLDIFNGDRKFWALKDELLTLVVKDLEGPLQAVFPDPSKLASVLGDYKEILGTPPALQACSQ